MLYVRQIMFGSHVIMSPPTAKDTSCVLLSMLLFFIWQNDSLEQYPVQWKNKARVTSAIKTEPD